MRGRLLLAAVLSPALLCNVAAADDYSSALSPDRSKLVREVVVGEGVILELVDFASGKAKPLVRLPGANRWPVWSPDGLFVAFCAEFQQRHFVTVSDLTGHSWLVQEISGGLTHISWSPDAVWLLYSAEASPGNRDVFIASAGGTDIRNLTQTEDASEDDVHWNAQKRLFQYRYRRNGAAADSVRTISLGADSAPK